MSKLKIFVLSLHRTGTQSTHELFMKSGLKAIHWPSKVAGVNYQEQVVGIERDYPAVLNLISPIIKEYDAMSDVPFPALYNELYEAYPDAFFLAVYRSPYDWVSSVRRHIGERELDPYEKIQYWKYLIDQPKYIYDLPDERLLEMHIHHHASLMQFFKEKPNFKIFHLTDPQIGEKMCKYLGLIPIPLGKVDNAKMWKPTMSTDSKEIKAKEICN